MSRQPPSAHSRFIQQPKPERVHISCKQIFSCTGLLLLVGLLSLPLTSCGGEKTGSREDGKPVATKAGSPISPGTRLGDFTVEEATQGWGKPQLNLSVTANPFSIAGQKYSNGIGTHAVSRIKIGFEPKFKVFSGSCGVDDWVKAGGSVVFEIRSDEKVLFASPLMRGGMRPVEFSVPVDGLSRLLLQVANGNANSDGDHANWVNLSLK